MTALDDRHAPPAPKRAAPPGDPAPGATAPGPRRRAATAVRLGPRSVAAIALTSVVGAVAFGWPLLAEAGSAAVAHAGDAPWLFAAVVPLLVAVVLAQVAEGGMDAKAVAMLGVLAAVVMALRPLGAGTAGLEPIWVVLVLGGAALGPGFGFTLGAVSLFGSALLTGGVGPWLPFQMIGAAWVGLGAGLVGMAARRLSPRAEVVLLAGYGAVAAFAYGILLNLWFWPFTADLAGPISYVPGGPLSTNLAHWLAFSVATSLAYDIPRAVLTATLTLVAGGTVLRALRRAARRAAFDAPVAFEPPAAGR